MITVIVVACFDIKVVLKGSSGVIFSNLRSDQKFRDEAAIDALETMILSHAIAGIDVAAPSYVSGIESAVEAMSHRLKLGGVAFFPLMKFYAPTL